MNKTFTVNDPSGKLLAGIKHCFLAHMILDLNEPPATIRASNGLIYQAVYDSVVIPANKDIFATKVIISFQQHDDGNFAIIRTLNPSTSKA